MYVKLLLLLTTSFAVCEDSSYEDVSSCGSCRIRQEIRTRSLQHIKKQVLQSMGYMQAPNTTGMQLPSVPQHVLQMVTDISVQGMQGDQPYKFQSGPSFTEEDDNIHIKTEKIITFAQQYPRLRHAWQKKDVLYFPFNEKITRHKVGKANLYVFVRGSEKRTMSQVILEVYKVVRTGSSQQPEIAKVTGVKVNQPYGSAGGWIRLDVSSMVSEWFKLPDHNLGFIVNGTFATTGKKVIVTDPSEKGKGPYVEIETEDNHKRRTRRSGLNCEDHSKETVCCRYPLTVDFEEFGWDFIIAPKRYDAYYCAGECPYLTLQKYTHTHLAVMAQPQSVGPCCSPKKMSSISMLYFDEQYNVIFGSLPGMVVDRCGCS